jgi:hypothetical protein
MNPFAFLGMEEGWMQTMTWSFEHTNHVIRLHFGVNQQSGPQELVNRHPSNWGWVLSSNATLWTSWRYDKGNNDEYVGKDEGVERLWSMNNRAI